MSKPRKPQPKQSYDWDDEPSQKPTSLDVIELEPKPLLYTSDGKPLVRKVGF